MERVLEGDLSGGASQLRRADHYPLGGLLQLPLPCPKLI